MEPKIIGNFNWHTFIIDKSVGDGSSYSDPMIDWLNTWCKENCAGQFFLLMSPVTIQFSTSINIISPIQKIYPPSTIKEYGKLMLSFENENDAVLFKTTFGGNV